MLIDLQLHSTYSDGYLTPSVLADMISNQGIRAASLTDHNTVAGLDEFTRECKKLNIKSIPGLELYVKHGTKKFNLLWYNYDPTEPDLHKLLRATQIRRRSSVRMFLKKLNKFGFNIDIEKILDKHNHYIPLNHVIDEVFSSTVNRFKARKEIGPHAREEDIISHYFYNKNIGRLLESYVRIENIIKLRKKIGGQLIINHPGKFGHFNMDMIKKLKKLGIDGLEVLSPHHSIGAVMFFQFVVNELKMISTGGSDFHKTELKKQLVKKSWDYFKIESKLLSGVEKIIKF